MAEYRCQAVESPRGVRAQLAASAPLMRTPACPPAQALGFRKPTPGQKVGLYLHRLENSQEASSPTFSKTALPFCTPACWGTRPPPRCWSARSSCSLGPCHPHTGSALGCRSPPAREGPGGLQGAPKGSAPGGDARCALGTPRTRPSTW